MKAKKPEQLRMESNVTKSKEGSGDEDLMAASQMISKRSKAQIREENNQELRTFKIHERDPKVAKRFKKLLLKYRHVENLLNLMLIKEFELAQSQTAQRKTLRDEDKENRLARNRDQEKAALQDEYRMFHLLQNYMVMKAVLMGKTGGEKTSGDIETVNRYYKTHSNPELKRLFEEAVLGCVELNDKNLSELIKRLKKDWSNFFQAVKKLKKAEGASNGNVRKASKANRPSYPKPKKLKEVFNYSIQLEGSKFSTAKLRSKGLLGMTLGKKQELVRIFTVKNTLGGERGKAPQESVATNGGMPEYLRGKTINSATVCLSHGHIYYSLQYVYTKKANNQVKMNSVAEADEERVESGLKEGLGKEQGQPKVAGLDVGLCNIASIFINDEGRNSLIISGRELVSYNGHFNKKMARLAQERSHQVKSWRSITVEQENKDGVMEDQEIQIPTAYKNEGERIKKKMSQMFERRNRYMDDYMQKLSRKVVQYLEHAGVSNLVMSKNLSFAKKEGEMKLGKKTRQKFYQIPFGRFLNLVESKLDDAGIEVVWIDEAYTSKTSSLTADVRKVVKKVTLGGRKCLQPNDLNGSRGSKKKKQMKLAKQSQINTRSKRVQEPKRKLSLGRGQFRDTVLNKVIHADLNAAANHIKLGSPQAVLIKSLWKYCNPIKIKSNHEFDKVLNVLNALKNSDYKLANRGIIPALAGQRLKSLNKNE